MSLFDELKKSNNKSVDFSKLFTQHSRHWNFLSNCTFELTPECNFRCKFCYARMSRDEINRQNKRLYSFEDWKRCIDELAEMQCVSLGITGGECTLHPDFCKVYSYAYRKGFTINVFTNGSNITDEIFELFLNEPPNRLFVTLYGNTPSMYKVVTGNDKYCEIVKYNIRKLAQAKIDVVMQGTFSDDNLSDLEAIYDFSAELDLEFRYSAQLLTYGHCTYDMADKVSLNDDEFIRQVRNIAVKKARRNGNKKQESLDANGTAKRQIIPQMNDPDAKGVTCGAGKNSCYINAFGYMMGCNTFDAYKIDMEGRSIRECFAELNDWANNIPRIKECATCIHVRHCTTCVAAHYNDTHQLGVPSPRLCYKIREPEKAAAERAFYEEHGYIEI